MIRISDNIHLSLRSVQVRKWMRMNYARVWGVVRVWPTCTNGMQEQSGNTSPRLTGEQANMTGASEVPCVQDHAGSRHSGHFPCPDVMKTKEGRATTISEVQKMPVEALIAIDWQTGRVRNPI